MKLELKPEGFERIESNIQSIEDLAWKGIDATDYSAMLKKFRQIISETKSFRQTLREVVAINPKAQAAGPDAA